MSSHSLLNVILIINSNCGDGKIAYIISSFLLFGSISTEMDNACSSVFYLILYVWQMCTYVHVYLFETGTSCARAVLKVSWPPKLPGTLLFELYILR